MVSYPLALLALAATASSETVLLDFYGDYCPPCRQMAPVVDSLAQAGYPVKKVNVTQNQQLAQQYQVTGIPCFVLVHNGQEVDRVVGATSASRLQGMFQRVGYRPGGLQPVRSQSPEAPGYGGQPGYGQPPHQQASLAQSNVTATPNARIALDEQRLADELRRCSVRLRIDDPDGHSFGTGTIIHSGPHGALIVTCGHLFRDSKGRGPITAELFDNGSPRKVPAQLITYDLKCDLALVSIREGRLPSAPLMAEDQQMRQGDSVLSIGCNHGNDPTVQFSNVTTVNRYNGPANLQVAGRPVMGRSGGGLFNHEGKLIGVCFAADPAADEGLYMAHRGVYEQLKKVGLSHLVEDQPSAPEPSALAAGSPPPLPPQMPSESATPPSSVQASLAGTLKPGERALLEQVTSGDTSAAEVICIVRPKDGQQSEIFVLKEPSPALLQTLAGQRNDQRHLTSMEVPKQRPQRQGEYGGRR